MENSLHGSRLVALICGVILGGVIIAFPDQFLFSKTVPNSFWTKYFPLPFGAGWFISFIALLPIIVTKSPLLPTIKWAFTSMCTSILVCVPISVFIAGGTLSINNFINQYMWVSLMCIPPFIVQMLLKSLIGWRKKYS